jgi:hypothetical protein
MCVPANVSAAMQVAAHDSMTRRVFERCSDVFVVDDAQVGFAEDRRAADVNPAALMGEAYQTAWNQTSWRARMVGGP